MESKEDTSARKNWIQSQRNDATKSALREYAAHGSTKVRNKRGYAEQERLKKAVAALEQRFANIAKDLARQRIKTDEATETTTFFKDSRKDSGQPTQSLRPSIFIPEEREERRL